MDQLPCESLTYIGDTAYNPYGEKPIGLVRRRSLENLDKLADSGVKMLIIACNTASAAVLGEARERYEHGRGIPVIEVIKPAARRAASVSRSGKVGVIATRATVASGAYEQAFSDEDGIRLAAAACPKFVEFAERGVTSGPEVLKAAEEYLAPVREAGVDTLVLGCTHYPLLAAAIGYVMGHDVSLVSSSQEAARSAYRHLAENGMFAAPDSTSVRSFHTTGDPGSFTELARRFLGRRVGTATSTEVIAQ